jgi:hypothetical protein
MTNAIMKSEPINLADLQSTARLLALSGYFDAKGNSETSIAQLATKILAGQEMGYGPFASVQGIHVIQGRPTLSANLMAAAVKAHPKYDYRVRKMEDTAVSIEFFEKGESLGVSTFTADDARKAGTKNTDKFPRNMLFARAMSNGVRWYCPDVFNGNVVYTPEDFDVDGETVRVVDASTGEITETKQHTNGNGNHEPAADIPAMVAGWLETRDPAGAAKSWAIESGYCKESNHAKNAMQKIVADEFGGVFKKSNMAQVLTAFYRDRLAKKNEIEETESISVEAAEPAAF